MAKKPYKKSFKKEKNENKDKSNIILETPKKNRKKINLGMKMKIIDLHKSGKSVVRIRKDLKLSQSTVSTILKDSPRIMEAVTAHASLKSTVITKKRTPIIEEMERILVAWLEEQMQEHVTISLGTIQAKARTLFNTLTENSNNPNEPTKFVASHGWFERFKKRHNLYNSSVAAETSSVNFEELNKLTESIDQQNFLQEQMFHNANEDDLNNNAYVSGLLNIEPQDFINNHLLMQSKQENLRENTEMKKFTISGLSKAFDTLNKAMDMFNGMDPRERRFENIKRLVDESIWCYKEVYDDLNRLEGIKNMQMTVQNESQNQNM